MVVDLVLDAIAAYRITRLVTADVITEGPRRAIVLAAFAGGHVPNLVALPGVPVVEALTDWEAEHPQHPAPKIATLVTCRWCAGVWVAAAVTVARRCAPRAWQPVAEWMTVAAACALLARIEDD